MNDELISVQDNEPQYDQDISYPLYVPGEYPIWFTDKETARFWCELDEDFSIEVLSPITAFYDHPVPFEVGEQRLDYTMELVDWREPEREAKRALMLGLTYRQPFLVEVSAHHYASHTQDGTEYDCDINWEILIIKPLPSDEVLKRWTEWSARGQQ